MRTEMARFLAATAVPSRLSLHPRAPGICPREPRAAYLYILRMEEPGRFHDATLVRIGRPSLTFLLIGWFSPAEEAKRPICSGFLRFRPERKGVYTNRPGNGPTEECEKSVLVEDPGASGCARSGAGLPDEAFRRFARDSSS